MVYLFSFSIALGFLMSSHPSFADDSWTIENREELDAAQVLNEHSAVDQVQNQPTKSKRSTRTYTTYTNLEEEKAKALAAVEAEKKSKEDSEKCAKGLTIQPLDGDTFHFHGCSKKTITLKFIVKDACGKPISHVSLRQFSPDGRHVYSYDPYETGDDGILTVGENTDGYEKICHKFSTSWKIMCVRRSDPRWEAYFTLHQIVD